MRVNQSVGSGLVLLGLLWLGSASAQTGGQPREAEAARPRVGLVLSGGGARGGAHIGVIRALEELRVPIDYIAGTSMGAIIGGFYASGMTVEDIERVVEGIDWDAAFLNAMPRRLKSFRRKRDDDLFLVNQKPGLNDGEFELPIGLVQGQVIDLILARETLHVAEVRDFDDLAIPFRAVAADISSGEPVVLGTGNLARALRASMSLPAAITPVEIDGRLLVDGGIAMNLPVQVAQSMGADVVIAVDISTPLRSREELRSVLDVATQLTNLLTRKGVEGQLELIGARDILLVPGFGQELSTVSFARMAETIPIGYQSAMERASAFSALALDADAYAAHRAARPDPRIEQLPVLDFVRLENHSRVADRVVETRLRDIEIGEPLDVDAVEKAVTKVYGLEFYQNVRYDVVSDGEQKGLEVELEQRSWGPNYLQLGVEFTSSGDEDAVFGLAASYLGTAINELGGEWRATLVVGDEPALLADLYQPFGRDTRFFFAPALNFESNLLNVFVDQQVVAETQLRQATLELAVGRELETWGEFRVGVRSAVGEVRLRVGDPAFLPEEDFRRGELFARFSADTLDDIAFPRSGVLASTEWRLSRPDSLSADVDFDQVLFNAAYAKTWGRHTVLSTLRYDTTLSGLAPVNRLFRLGGFFDLSGLNQNQLSGQHAMRLGAAYYRRIGDLALFPAFAGFSVQLGNVWDSRSDISLDGMIWGGSLWAGVDTPVGPIYVGYGRAEGGVDAYYVFLGRPF